MGTLSYTATMSLDGYASDAEGDFQWSAPGEEVFRFHIDRLAKVSTEVLGRKTYLLMKYWEQAPEDGSWGADEHAFAERWRGIEHVVASSTLPSDQLSGGIRLVPDLGLPELEQIVTDAAGEVEIFGPTTAAAAIRAGMVQDFHILLVPKIVGGGLPALPADARLDLRLVERRVFDDSGTTYLHYQRSNGSGPAAG